MLTEFFFSNVLNFIDNPYFLIFFSLGFFFAIFILSIIFLKIIFFRPAVLKNSFFWLFFLIIFSLFYFVIMVLLLPDHEKYYPKEKITFNQKDWNNKNNRYRMILNSWEDLKKQNKIEIRNRLGAPINVNKKNVNKKQFDNADFVYDISSPSFILFVKKNKTNYLNDFLGIKKKFLLIWLNKEVNNLNKIEIRDAPIQISKQN